MLRHFHRIVGTEIAADDRTDGHHQGLRPEDCAADDEGDRGDAVDDGAEDGLERIHFVDVGHTHGGEHGEVHDADAAAEVAAVDGDEEFEMEAPMRALVVASCETRAEMRRVRYLPKVNSKVAPSRSQGSTRRNVEAGS